MVENGHEYLYTAVLAVFWAAISNQALAIEGGYSNYFPGFYGDIALAVEPADGLSFRNDVYFFAVPKAMERSDRGRSSSKSMSI